MNVDEIKRDFLRVVLNKKYQWIATLIILFIVLMMSSSIRLSNWDLLTDSTTGEKIPLALDPYYFLRISETIVANDGELPEFDEMRVHGFDTPWHAEIMPRIVVEIWKIASIFGDYTLREVNIFSPVLFYGIGLILFFILAYILTKSKLIGILACSFLAFSPAYLYRTMAGFSDHEAIGMIGFFCTMIGFVLAMRYLAKMKKRGLFEAGIAGLVIGASTLLTILLWSGIATFIFMIVPISFVILWIIKLKNEGSYFKDNGLVFYFIWIISTIVIASLVGLSFSGIVSKYMLGSNSIISLAVLGFIVIDRLIVSFGNLIKSYNKKYRIGYSAGILVILGMIILPIIGKGFFGLLWEVLNKLLNPAWGYDRVGATVAENAQPYLIDWIGTAGIHIFWLFVAGAALIGIEFSKNIKSRKNRYLLVFGFCAMICGILFSRISSDSILDGNGIFSLSGLFYIGGIAIFAYAFLKNYFSKEIKVDVSIIILFAWMFVMLIVGRSTTRLFFVIAPFMCLLAGYFIMKVFEIWKKGGLEEISKVLVIGILIVSVIAGSISIYGSYNSISNQAKYTGPSANEQWQNAMKWVRENATENSVFAHWWDYGYWIQTLGRRATIADGGHAQTVYDGNHKIGRYVLTTPQPETALSFFKTMDVNYLLIDQTDLGKYPAYSKIGGGNDEEGESSDRYSAIPLMPNDPKQTIETTNGTTVVFSGGMYLFEDIIYNKNGMNVFLPAGKAAIVGVVANIEGNSLKQPDAVYIYNNIQTRIPVRYVYINGEIVDFGSGLDVIIDIIPAFAGNSINNMGAAIYLSQKVSKSLFARLYLLDDVFNEYETLELVHSEENQVIANLKTQGVSIGDFIYYQGFRGPIKIWDVSSIPEGIKVVKEFKDGPTGEYGSLDSLDFGSR